MMMRGFSRVDQEGRVPIPVNMRRQAGLKPGELVEIKVAGPGKAQFLMINKREKPR